ncbi:MAG: hypothetical protein MUO58_16800 [Anaerolineales bacterium]|jgi:hypothetical protein|nr:hypothetical protein [Anaerolineales bacterium]
MLPYIVIILAVVYFVMKGTGLLDEFAKSRRTQGDPEESLGRRLLDRMRTESDMNRRLEVFKDYLGNNDEEEDE